MHAELVVGDKINLSKHSGCILEPYMGRFMPHSTVSKHYKDCEHYKDCGHYKYCEHYKHCEHDKHFEHYKHCEHHQQTSPLHAGQE